MGLLERNSKKGRGPKSCHLQPRTLHAHLCQSATTMLRRMPAHRSLDGIPSRSSGPLVLGPYFFFFCTPFSICMEHPGDEALQTPTSEYIQEHNNTVVKHKTNRDPGFRPFKLLRAHTRGRQEIQAKNTPKTELMISPKTSL